MTGKAYGDIRRAFKQTEQEGAMKKTREFDTLPSFRNHVETAQRFPV